MSNVKISDLPTVSTLTGASLVPVVQGGVTKQTTVLTVTGIVRASQFTGADLGVQITNAIASLPSTGGIVDCSDLQGAQTIPSKVSISKSNITLLFGSATFTLSGVTAVQVPFGAQFLVTGANVWFRGNGATIFKLGAGAQADCIGFLHGSTLGGAIGIEFDGNKANNTSITDDSFQSAIQIISDSGVGATVDSRITVENCVIHDFNHYGVVTYGNLSNRNSIRNNLIYSNGKNDTNGTGDGIFINKGSGNNHVSGNRCYSNQRSGIRLCAVGVNADNNKIVGNWCYSNTEHGIRSTEESNLGSTSGTGQAALLISGNHCYSNTKSGIWVGTFNNVGFIKNSRLDSNFCYSNTEYGILLQSNATTDNVRQTVVCGNEVFSNTLDGIGVAVNVLDTIVCANTVIGNANPIIDSGTRTLIYGNKALITDGTFYVTGTSSFGGLITAAAGITASAGQIKYTGTLGAGVYSATITGAAGAARDIFQAGQTGSSNGFTVQWDTISMVYKFNEHQTTASAANAYLDTGDSTLKRSTSSLRYKKDLAPITIREARAIVMRSRGFSYSSAIRSDDGRRRWLGFGAEDIVKVDSRLVHQGPNGPEGVQYERYVVPHNVMLQDQEERIAVLEALVKGRNAGLKPDAKKKRSIAGRKKT